MKQIIQLLLIMQSRKKEDMQNMIYLAMYVSLHGPRLHKHKVGSEARRHLVLFSQLAKL